MKTHYSTPESEEYFFDEGCHILELCNSTNHPSLSIARARVEPNTETKLHALDKTIERYIIQTGHGIATIDEQTYTVSANDVLIIDANVSQKIRNTGNDDLIFLVVCSPRFEVSCYQDLS